MNGKTILSCRKCGRVGLVPARASRGSKIRCMECGYRVRLGSYRGEPAGGAPLWPDAPAFQLEPNRHATLVVTAALAALTAIGQFLLAG